MTAVGNVGKPIDAWCAACLAFRLSRL